MEADEDGDGEVDVAEFQSVMGRKASEAVLEVEQDGAQHAITKFSLERANRTIKHRHEEMMDMISKGQSFGLEQVYPVEKEKGKKEEKEDLFLRDNADKTVRAITACIHSIDCCI